MIILNIRLLFEDQSFKNLVNKFNLNNFIPNNASKLKCCCNNTEYGDIDGYLLDDNENEISNLQICELTHDEFKLFFFNEIFDFIEMNKDLSDEWDYIENYPGMSNKINLNDTIIDTSIGKVKVFNTQAWADEDWNY